MTPHQGSCLHRVILPAQAPAPEHRQTRGRSAQLHTGSSPPAQLWAVSTAPCLQESPPQNLAEPAWCWAASALAQHRCKAHQTAGQPGTLPSWEVTARAMTCRNHSCLMQSTWLLLSTTRLELSSYLSHLSCSFCGKVGFSGRLGQLALSRARSLLVSSAPPCWAHQQRSCAREQPSV